MPGDTSRANGKKGGRPRKPRVPALAVPAGWPQAEAPPPDGVFVLTPNDFGLKVSEERFVAAYLVDGNAARAYRAAHPACSDATSYTNGPATLRKTHIADAVVAARAAQWRRLGMDGDEALARLANVARGDIGDVLREGDPLRALAPEVRARIKRVRETKHGREIELYDAQAAAVTILKATGRLTEQHEHKVLTLEYLVSGMAPPAAPLALPPAEGAA